MDKPICSKFKTYLTIDAQLELDRLVNLGLDPDLALAILEQELPEELLYELPRE